MTSQRNGPGSTQDYIRTVQWWRGMESAKVSNESNSIVMLLITQQGVNDHYVKGRRSKMVKNHKT